MMFLIGQGERVVDLGPPEPHDCPRCGERTQFQKQLRYKYGSFDMLFGFAYDKRYQLACLQCNHGWILDTKATERELGEVPIPFHLRRGFFILIVLAVLLAASVYAFKQANGLLP